MHSFPCAAIKVVAFTAGGQQGWWERTPFDLTAFGHFPREREKIT